MPPPPACAPIPTRYRQSFLAVLPIAIVSPVLGMAEGALADFLAMASARTTRAASMQALASAARLLMFRDLAEAFETAARPR